MNDFTCPECGRLLGNEVALSWHREGVHGVERQRPAAKPAASSGHTRQSQVRVERRGTGRATVGEMVLRARDEYVSIDQFADRVVVPELERAALYTRERGLTPAGEAARADLERRMGGALREMHQQRGPWVDQEPRKALLAAALAVALGKRTVPNESDLQAVGQQVEIGDVAAAAPHGTSDQHDILFDWYFLSQFDTYFVAMDSEVDAGGDGGDGDGGDGGDGGGGGE